MMLKGKDVPCVNKHHAMKIYTGVYVQVHIFLTSTRGGFTLRPLYPRIKSLLYPLHRDSPTAGLDEEVSVTQAGHEKADVGRDR